MLGWWTHQGVTPGACVGGWVEYSTLFCGIYLLYVCVCVCVCSAMRILVWSDINAHQRGSENVKRGMWPCVTRTTTHVCVCARVLISSWLQLNNHFHYWWICCLLSWLSTGCSLGWADRLLVTRLAVWSPPPESLGKTLNPQRMHESAFLISGPKLR